MVPTGSHDNTMLPLKEDNPLYNSKIIPTLADPKVCIIQRFYCISLTNNSTEVYIIQLDTDHMITQYKILLYKISLW